MMQFSSYVLAIFHFCTAQAILKLPENVTVPAVFAFGDSVIDTGNNNNNLLTTARCNFPPYGRDFMGGKPTGRFCNGKVPVDFIVEQLGIKKLLPAYFDPDLQTEDLLTGVNFASGGAGFDPLTSELMIAISLSEQLELFKDYTKKVKELVGEERTRTIITNSLFLVVAVTDDIAINYFYTLARALEYDVSAYTNLLSTLASVFLEDLYKLGARWIGVLSAPPMGCLPVQRTLIGGVNRDCSETLDQAAQMWNSKLRKLLNDLNNKLPQARMVYLDGYVFFNDIIQNPTKYGFEIADRACCGTGLVEVSFLCNLMKSLSCTNESKYVFWDSYHPTEKAYKLLADNVLQTLISNFFL